MKGELFVSKVWQICKAKGIKKSEFYEAAGISPSAMCLYKKGENTPTIDTLRAIADVLDIDVSYLLADLYGSSEEKEPASQAGSEPNPAIMELLRSLTPAELAQVQGFVSGLISSRKA